MLLQLSVFLRRGSRFLSSRGPRSFGPGSAVPPGAGRGLIRRARLLAFGLEDPVRVALGPVAGFLLRLGLVLDHVAQLLDHAAEVLQALHLLEDALHLPDDLVVRRERPGLGGIGAILAIGLERADRRWNRVLVQRAE